MTGGILDGWTIFDHPTDFPDFFVSRRWIANRDGAVTATQDVLKHKNLDTLRGMTERVAGRPLHRLDRLLADQPNILEVWI